MQHTNAFKMSKENKPCSEQQKKFCEEYAIDFNGTRAAIAAGYSEKSAKQVASRLLTYANVKAYLAELRSEQKERTNITADMVIQELALLGFSNMQNYMSEGNRILSVEDLEKNHAAAISEIRTERRLIGEEPVEFTRIKLHDKKGSLELLGKHLGLFIDRVKHEGEMVINVRRKVIQGNASDIKTTSTPQVPAIGKK